MEIDEDLIIPDKSKSIMEGAIVSFGEGSLKGRFLDIMQY